MFQLTIDDWIKLRQNEMIELTSKTIERFKHIYRHLRHEMPFLFVDHVSYQLLLDLYVNIRCGLVQKKSMSALFLYL